MPTMTYPLAKKIVRAKGELATKAYLREYFANRILPEADPFQRVIEFAQFFFPEVFEIEWCEMHTTVLRDLLSGSNFADAAPRGHGKTTTITLGAIYSIVNVLDHFILIVSDTYGQARDITDGIKQQLEGNELLRWVYGDLVGTFHWTSGAFTTANEVRVMARGSNMKVRGLKYKHWRPGLVLGDDLENDEAVESEDRRTKLENWIKKALIPCLRKGGRIGVVGTILHEDSLLAKMVTGKSPYAGWRHNRFKALIEENTTERALWPGQYSVAELKAMRDDPAHEKYIGPIVFSQEYQNEPADEGSRIIKAEWLYGPEDNRRPYLLAEKEAAFKELNPEATVPWWRAEMREIIAAVDPAISEEDAADWFAIVVTGIGRDGHIWLLDYIRLKTSDIDKQVEAILAVNATWKPDKMKVETVAYQKGLAVAVRKAAARDHVYVPVFEVKPDKDKFRRAVIHSANFAGGLVHVRLDHEMADAFIAEVLAFPKGKNDDMFDAYMNTTEDTVQKAGRRTFGQKPRGF